MTLSNRAYDILKRIAQYILPAAATLYFTLADIWGLPYAEKIVATVAAINAFLGVLLEISSARYNKSISASDDSES